MMFYDKNEGKHFYKGNEMIKKVVFLKAIFSNPYSVNNRI